MRFDTKTVDWYEDCGIMEWFAGNGEPENRKVKYCSLKEAVEFAFKNKLCLCIQPEEQDVNLFIDFTE